MNKDDSHEGCRTVGGLWKEGGETRKNTTAIVSQSNHIKLEQSRGREDKKRHFPEESSGRGNCGDMDSKAERGGVLNSRGCDEVRNGAVSDRARTGGEGADGERRKRKGRPKGLPVLVCIGSA